MFKRVHSPSLASSPVIAPLAHSSSTSLEIQEQEEQEADVVQLEIRHEERQDVQQHEAGQRKARRNSLVARAMEKEVRFIQP